MQEQTTQKWAEVAEAAREVAHELLLRSRFCSSSARSGSGTKRCSNPLESVFQKWPRSATEVTLGAIPKRPEAAK